MIQFDHFTPANTPRYLASKWIHIPFLIGIQDWKELFAQLGDPILLCSSGVYKEDEICTSLSQFLLNWERYLEDLRTGPIHDAQYKPLFSLFWSSTSKTLGLIDVGDNRVCATQVLPNIVLQAHRFQYSSVDKKFRRQVFGSDTVSWGLQASFPMLMQDSKTREINKVLLSRDGANTALWIQFQKWLKNTTMPVTFQTADCVETVPFRISSSCLRNIDQHYELNKRGISVIKKV